MDSYQINKNGSRKPQGQSVKFDIAKKQKALEKKYFDLDAQIKKCYNEFQEWKNTQTQAEAAEDAGLFSSNIDITGQQI